MCRLIRIFVPTILYHSTCWLRPYCMKAFMCVLLIMAMPLL
jgi:hypothetical protein